MKIKIKGGQKLSANDEFFVKMLELDDEFAQLVKKAIEDCNIHYPVDLDSITKGWEDKVLRWSVTIAETYNLPTQWSVAIHKYLLYGELPDPGVGISYNALRSFTMFNGYIEPLEIIVYEQVSRTNLIDWINKNGEIISDQEYKQQKEILLTEKKRLEEQLQDTSHRQESWMDTAEKIFNFTVNCRYWFNNGTKDEKRIIAGTFGLNLTLENRLLRYDLLKPFELVKQAADTLKDDAKRIEPKKRTVIAGQSYYLDKQNPVWGG